VSWEQLRSIAEQDRQEREFYAGQPPRACPNDGTPLETGPNGELFCRHDGFSWPRDSALPGEGGNV
jgi:hypothetical protein